MWQKLSSIISNSPILTACLKTLGWAFALVAIVFATIIAREQEITFVYNAF
jgi:hypothetical protein